MRSYKTEGIIIKRYNIGEADRILTVFTKDQGKIQIKASGVRKITSRRSPHIELFNLSLMTLHIGKKYSILTEAITLNNFSNLKGDLKKVGVLYHICELIDGLCPENQENRRIYFLLKELLESQMIEDNFFKAIYIFEVKLLELLGYWPENKELSRFQISPFIEEVLERKLKTRQILPRLF